eukprot:1762033-Pleurochrysis_carterae.AAC.2
MGSAPVSCNWAPTLGRSLHLWLKSTFYAVRRCDCLGHEAAANTALSTCDAEIMAGSLAAAYEAVYLRGRLTELGFPPTPVPTELRMTDTSYNELMCLVQATHRGSCAKRTLGRYPMPTLRARRAHMQLCGWLQQGMNVVNDGDLRKEQGPGAEAPIITFIPPRSLL